VQFLFLLGVLGELWLAASQGWNTSIVTYVAEHPSNTLLIGPAFAAVTGVAVKEGLCYGKPEAGILALVCCFFPCGTIRVSRAAFHAQRHCKMHGLNLYSKYTMYAFSLLCVTLVVTVFSCFGCQIMHADLS
jgi:hypothetical protein